MAYDMRVFQSPSVMLALYPSHGGKPLGFYCAHCARVTKTEHGMWRHLKTHGIKKQPDLPFEEKKDERPATVGV